jgi:hypothetical protein
MDWKMSYMGKVRLELINRWANGFDLRALDLAHRIETQLPDADGTIRPSVPLLNPTDPSLSSDKPLSGESASLDSCFSGYDFVDEAQVLGLGH